MAIKCPYYHNAAITTQAPGKLFEHQFPSLYKETKGVSGGSAIKNPSAMQETPSSIPGWGRSPGEGNGNPLQYSCLRNPTGRGAWRATAHGVTKSPTRLSNNNIKMPGSGKVDKANSSHSAWLERNIILRNGIIHHLYHYRNTRQTLGLKESPRRLLS